MPELSGTITRKSAFGIQIDDNDVWYNWSKEEYRKEPFEMEQATKGKRVVCELSEKYPDRIVTVKVLDGGAQPPTPPVPGEPGQPTASREWGYEHKDRLMCRESCAKSAVAIFAASIQAGIYKTHPDVSAVTAYAAALEKWCLEAID